jgi:hypothetical protein
MTLIMKIHKIVKRKPLVIYPLTEALNPTYGGYIAPHSEPKEYFGWAL